MVLPRAREVVVTDGRAFGAFVKDVLWRYFFSTYSSTNPIIISGKDLKVPSERIPAGIYISHASPALSVEIWASYEVGRMLGNGDGHWETSNGRGMSYSIMEMNPSVILSFPLVRDIHPSLTLKAATGLACDDQDDALSDTARSLETQIRARTICRIRDEQGSPSPERRSAAFSVGSRPVSSAPDHATALTNLAYARLKGADLAPNKRSTAADIREAAKLYHELLPLCPEGTCLRSVAAGANGADYVINGCNNLPIDASDEGIHLRRVILELCLLGHQQRPRALDKLAWVLQSRFQQHGNIDYLDTSIQLRRDAVSLCPEGHTGRACYLNNLAFSLVSRFRHQGKPNGLDEVISLDEEALRLRPVGHKYRGTSLDNLGLALVSRFHKRGNIDDITRAISLYREALTLFPPGHPCRDTTLNNLAFALDTRYDKLHVSKDLKEAIDLYRECLQSVRHDHPERHTYLQNPGFALCLRFMRTRENEDVEEAIQLCQESLAAVSLLHPSRHFGYMRLKDAYLSCYRILHDPADLSLAVENFRLASQHPTQGYPQRIIQAYNWTVVAKHHMGRGQQWSLASRLKTPVEDLESANPKLAHDYLDLSRRISNAAQSSATITDRAALIEQKPSTEDLQGNGKLREPHHVPLPSVALVDLNNLKDRFARAIRHASSMGPKVPRNDLIVLLRTVWDQIMLPIVNMMKKRVAPSFVTIGQGQPGAGKGKALLAVDSELELVHKLVPATANTTISGDAATRIGALEALEQNTWCTSLAMASRTLPYNSHFVMRDEHLTCLISWRNIFRTQFAFLSLVIPPSAIRRRPTNFRDSRVIGTLWEVDDSVAKHVVKAFYENLFADMEDGGVMDCTKAAWALNRATHAVKTKVPLEQRMVFHSYRKFVRCSMTPSSAHVL
ncbi:hypothetical protein DFJ58DRAFT_845063 [Suillus subalutaceus]|uniref:uncharacterized protein n=1 Tax=Suillus subalutaceus TaxID=48586 RepID=UPI001B85D571|nr:uncharacterized protein DFJ58DRAFT_845063 [Suillus subalutaceus]KAG1841218.1 hypothetical protein DFJ58DRAFT_845063 [Suillus subalutaceus]